MPFKKLAVLFSLWQVQLGILLLHILIGIITLYSFIFNLQLTESYLTANSLDKQSIVARSGARSVENFFNSVVNQLYSMVFSFDKVDENAVIDKNNTREEFSRYISQAKAPISGIALYDENGKLLIIENIRKITVGENEDFSDEVFVQWSKNAANRGKIFITRPFISRSGSSKGKTIMAVATPLYFGNKYRGTLAIRFLVEQFKGAFINPLTSDLEEDTQIVDSSGTIIAGDNRIINKNLVDYAKEERWDRSDDFVSKFSSLLQKQLSKTSWTFKYPGGMAKNYLVASSRIDVPNTDSDLYLIISTVSENSSKPISPIRSYGSIWAVLSIVFTLFGGVIYIIMRRAA